MVVPLVVVAVVTGAGEPAVGSAEDHARWFLLHHYRAPDLTLDELRGVLLRNGLATRFAAVDSVSEQDLNAGMRIDELAELDKLFGWEPTRPGAAPGLWFLIFHEGQDVRDVAVGTRTPANLPH